MVSEKFEQGLSVRREVLGDEYVDRALATMDDFGRDFQEWVTESAWGTRDRWRAVQPVPPSISNRSSSRGWSCRWNP